MAGIQPLNTNFLTDTSAAQLSASQLGGGFSALAGGVATGIANRRQDEQLATKATEREEARQEKQQMEVIKMTYDDNPELAGKLMTKFFPDMGEAMDVKSLVNKNPQFKADLDTLIKSISTSDERTGNALIAAWQGKYPKKSKGLAPTLRGSLASGEINLEPSKFLGDALLRAGMEVSEYHSLAEDDPSKIAVTNNALKLAGKLQSTKTEAKGAAEKKVDLNAALLDKAIRTHDTESLRSAEQHQSLNDLKDIGNYVTLSRDQQTAYQSLSDGLAGQQRALAYAKEAFSSNTKAETLVEELQSRWANVPYIKQLVPSKIRSYKALTNEIIANVARSQGHSGVLTELDVAKSFDALPGGGDSPEMRALKTLYMEDMLQNTQRNYLIRAKDKKAATADFKTRTERVINMGKLMSDKTTKKLGMTFQDMFTKLNGQGKSMVEIENTWNSPDGADSLKDDKPKKTSAQRKARIAELTELKRIKDEEEKGQQ